MIHKCNIKVLKKLKSKEKVRIHTNFYLNMLHLLIIKVKISSVNKADIRKCLMHANVIKSLAY